jgi:hypothetical protein
MKYNFARATALRVTPAIEAGLADHVWSIEQIVGLGQTASSGSVSERNDKRQAGRIVDGLRV